MKTAYAVYCKDTKEYLAYYPANSQEHTDEIALFSTNDKAYDYMRGYIKSLDKMNKRKNESAFYRVEVMNVR